MSYDLYFSPTSGVGHDAFTEHFDARHHYSVNEHQAWYSNDDTGVYFSFDYVGPEEQSELDDEMPAHWASFNLNLHRPHFFASEAAIEIGAFLDRFPGDTVDPQSGDETPRSYSPDAFTTTWIACNRLASDAAAAHAPSAPSQRYDRDRLRRIWQWNYGRADRQRTLGNHVFVPYIALYTVDDTLVTGAVWSDVIPTVLPRTDVVLLVCAELAPKRLFRKKTPTIAAVPWEDVAPHLASWRTDAEPIEHRYPDYDTATPELLAWFRGQPANPSITGVAFDQVLDDS